MSFNRRDIGRLTRSRAAMARMSFRDIESFRRGRRAPLTGDPRQAPDRCCAASRRLGLSKISETLPLNNLLRRARSRTRSVKAEQCRTRLRFPNRRAANGYARPRTIPSMPPSPDVRGHTACPWEVSNGSRCSLPRQGRRDQPQPRQHTDRHTADKLHPAWASF
jgi:hypothetical protein